MTSQTSDFVSVVMPVHNALPHLDQAVASILDQTHRNFEFILYDDASTDGSAERLAKLAGTDDRIRIFSGPRNLGPVGSSAKVVSLSSAPLVARMDADDLCHPERLARQIRLLRSNPEAGLVGTLFNIVDAVGRRLRGPDYWRLGRQSAIAPFAAHGSIMFRRALFDRVGGYRPECEYWEDQDLLGRMAAISEIWVIPEPLYSVRQWTRAASPASDENRTENAVDLMYRCMARRERNLPYDDLLLESRSKAPARVDPRVVVAAGSKQLWSGERPKLFGRLLRRGRLRLDRHTVTALAWTSWAALSPSTLRAALGALLRTKNARARLRRKERTPLRWSPARLPD